MGPGPLPLFTVYLMDYFKHKFHLVQLGYVYFTTSPSIYVFENMHKMYSATSAYNYKYTLYMTLIVRLADLIAK